MRVSCPRTQSPQPRLETAPLDPGHDFLFLYFYFSTEHSYNEDDATVATRQFLINF